MSDGTLTRAFLLEEVERLEPFDFVAFGPAGKPLEMLEVTRGEDQALEVRLPGRPPPIPPVPAPVRSALRDRGFTSPDPSEQTAPWVRGVESPAAAVDLVLAIAREVFGEKDDVRFDVAHGSHRAEHDALRRLAEVRGRVEAIATAVLGRAPTQDADGDFVLPIGDVHVTVAPRVGPGGPVVVRVFAITNVAVAVTPELGLFLARLNFGLMFGRFALDAEHRAIWFDETLLGEQFTDEELRFTIKVVASTADQWDDRLKQMFGGSTYEEVLNGRSGAVVPPTKPGQGGYL